MADYRYRNANASMNRMMNKALYTAESMDSGVLSKMPIAMAYVPFQQWRDIYNLDYALERGTIFKELDLPFCGKGAV